MPLVARVSLRVSWLRRSWLRGSMFLALTGLGGCGETVYPVFWETDPVGDGDSVVTGGGPAAGVGGSSGGQAFASGGASGGTVACTDPEDCGADTGGQPTGLGGALPPPPGKCKSDARPGFGLVQLKMHGSGLCMVPGASKVILGYLAYDVTVSECEDLPEQYWTVVTDIQNTWEFRNESLGMNLDIQFGVDSNGAPALLFDPHQYYNQRFFATMDGAEDGMRIRPSNSTDKCLTQIDAALLLMPCNPDGPNQLIHVVPCVE